ncbi:DNA-deoxyinosine glycosylase [Paenibacillus sp. UNC451MF]|uniref:DNA-deoxyinosine glycosylase n=1 Tax=Paenibacillus sp. UNC451MF TaxID=1449063 RepID=UPI00048D6C89|nr:DNA-deoxyinosine glycosylase [Paenibacillus sp. UNC451MF]
MERDRLLGLPPVMDASCHTVVLGSMPGALSLSKQEYYGHPRNHFWKLLYSLFGGTSAEGVLHNVPSDSYEERLAFALSHGIGLWDVLAACEREGSLDAQIRKPEANDFAWFFLKYPAVRRVFFNGQAAGELYRKQVLPKLGELAIGGGISYAVLPSSSTARAMALEAKLVSWQELRAEEGA